MINPDIDWKKRKLTYRTIVSHISSRHPKNVPNPCPYQVQGSVVKVPLMVGAQAFMKATKNGNMFAIYVISTSQLVQEPTKLPIEYEEYRECLRRRTLIHFFNIDLMIVASNSKKVRNLPLVQSTASPKTSLPHCEITLMKISRRTSFDIPTHLLELLSYLSRRETTPFECAWTIVD